MPGGHLAVLRHEAGRPGRLPGDATAMGACLGIRPDIEAELGAYPTLVRYAGLRQVAFWGGRCLAPGSRPAPDDPTGTASGARSTSSAPACGVPEDPVSEQFDGFLELVPVVDRLMADTVAPRSPEDLLLDLVEPLGLSSSSLVFDAGSYDGTWARRLEKRFGSEVVAVDLVPGAAGAAAQNGTRAVIGDVQHLPVRAAVADLVWCRDVLSCVPDPPGCDP